MTVPMEWPKDSVGLDPGSPEEMRRFAELQLGLERQFRDIFPQRNAHRSVVVIPSLSMDAEVMAKISGVHHYEERMLCLLLLLRLPHTRLIFVTSQPIAPAIIDYYLHLLPGIPGDHARRRLTLLTCHDASNRPLSQKILERPRLMQRILRAVPDRSAAHMTCFAASPLERTLAVRLGLPLYGCDPALCELGSKSGSRRIFREAGIALPDGFEDLRNVDELVEALTELRARHPELGKAVVKLDEGFSGEGNATFSYQGAPEAKGSASACASGLGAWIRQRLPQTLQFEARGQSWEPYRAKLEQMGGVVESFIDGSPKRSPSVQCRISPLGEVEMISTHDQVLGGPTGQIFLGSTFPADREYRLEIQEAGMKVGKVLQRHGALARYGVDFVSVKREGRWEHYAIEINLRKGGTTHTFLMLQFLTAGSYEMETGRYRIPTGPARYYYASDNVESEAYRGLTPTDLIDIAVENEIHFHGATQQGTMFHLMGALSEFGKLGMVCVADSRARAKRLYQRTVEILDEEARRHHHAAGEERVPARVPL